MPRRTRIVATLGPATDRPGVLERLLEIGVDVARINFSHGAPEEHLGRVERFRQASRKAGRVTAVMGDLPGPKLRPLLKPPLDFPAGKSFMLGLRGTSASDIQVTEPEAVSRVRP